MRIKIIELVLTLLLVASCASKQEQSPEYISQNSKFYESSSFAEVWSSSMRSIEELGFMIREAIRDKGLLDAIYEDESAPDSPPSLLNVMIIQELGQIKVNCLALMSGDQGNYQTTLAYVQDFFTYLEKYLKN
jgi:hypothetical protein